MRVLALRAHVAEVERHAALLLLAFDRATTGSSGPGQGAAC